MSDFKQLTKNEPITPGTIWAVVISTVLGMTLDFSSMSSIMALTGKI